MSSRTGGQHLIAAGGWLYELAVRQMERELLQCAALADSPEAARAVWALEAHVLPIAEQARFSRALQVRWGIPAAAAERGAVSLAMDLLAAAHKLRAAHRAQGRPVPGDEVLGRGGMPRGGIRGNVAAGATEAPSHDQDVDRAGPSGRG